MTKGQADEHLLDSCTAQGIIVLESVPHKALLGLAGDGDVVTYITDANEVSRPMINL